MLKLRNIKVALKSQPITVKLLLIIRNRGFLHRCWHLPHRYCPRWDNGHNAVNIQSSDTFIVSDIWIIVSYWDTFWLECDAVSCIFPPAQVYRFAGYKIYIWKYYRGRDSGAGGGAFRSSGDSGWNCTNFNDKILV